MHRLLLATILTLTISYQSIAGYSLSWSSNNVSAVAGEMISVDLILSESSTSNIFDFGVSGALFTGTIDGVATTFSTAAPGPDFDPPFDVGLPSDATISGNVATIRNISFLGAGIGSNNVVVGSFSFTSAIEGMGTLVASGLFDLDDDFGVYVAMDGNILPVAFGAFSPGPGSFNYTFTAVPEPTSLVFGGILGGAGFIAFRRQRKAKQAKSLESTTV